MSLPIVCYHKACVDGWCSAWIMDRCLGGCELIACQYGDDPPNVDGRTVFVLDFSFPRDVMIEMHRAAHQMLVLDHHATSEADCKDLPFCIFDMERSGAGLTYWWCRDQGYVSHLQSSSRWRDVANGMKVMADYVQDRDLFNHALDSTETINAAIRSYPFDLEEWDYLAKRMKVTPFALHSEGEAIQRYRGQIAKQHIRNSFEAVIDGCSVPVAYCTTGDIISDVCGELAKGRLFAATICPTSDGRLLVSLRSDEHGMDVGVIAKKFGGGGHKHASGFRLPYRSITEISTTKGIVEADTR